MRIFVYEFITGGGLAGEPLPPPLAREGDVMLQALARDLVTIPGIELVTLRDPRLAPLPLPIATHTPATAREASLLFARCVDDADATWVIAPETGQVLERLSERVIARGRTLLGSRPDAVRIAASKSRTVAELERRGVPVAPVFNPAGPLPPLAGPIVLKPDDGAGCNDTYFLPGLRAALDTWEAGGRPRTMLLQPFVAGASASLSLLARDGRAVLLCVNRQKVAVDGEQLRFLGCVVNGFPELRTPLAGLVEQIAAALPGLWGYVGVDLVLTASGPVVIEVNPRLTTSYAGLAAALGVNPAALVLALLDGENALPVLPPPRTGIEVSLEPAHGW